MASRDPLTSEKRAAKDLAEAEKTTAAMERLRRMPGGTLAEQIRLAQKSMSEWPEWMKRTAYFAGSNEVHNVD